MNVLGMIKIVQRIIFTNTHIISILTYNTRRHYKSKTNGLNISHWRPLRSTSDNAIITSIKCLNFLNSYSMEFN